MVDQLDQFQGTITQQENIYEARRALQQKQQECESVEGHTGATQGILWGVVTSSAAQAKTSTPTKMPPVTTMTTSGLPSTSSTSKPTNTAPYINISEKITSEPYTSERISDTALIMCKLQHFNQLHL